MPSSGEIRTVELTRERDGRSDPSLRPVTLLVFFPAAAGAGVIAANFVVASLNSLRRDWYFSAIEDEWREGS